MKLAVSFCFSYTYNVSSSYINCYFFVALNLCSSVRTHFLCLLFLKIGTPTVFLDWLDLFYAALRKTNFGFKVTSLICLIIWINQLLLDTIFFSNYRISISLMLFIQWIYFLRFAYGVNIWKHVCYSSDGWRLAMFTKHRYW